MSLGTIVDAAVAQFARQMISEFVGELRNEIIELRQVIADLKAKKPEPIPALAPLSSRTYLTIPEAAALAGDRRRTDRKPLSLYTVRQWANTGQLKAYKLDDCSRVSQWRIAREELERVLEHGLDPVGTYKNDEELPRHC